MKPSLIAQATLLALLILASCGKKAEDNDRPQTDDVTSASDIYFDSFLDMERAIVDNDIESLKEAYHSFPSVQLNQTLLSSGETYLILAIKNDYRAIRNFLIDKGANPNTPNIHKETPLIAAAANGHENSVQILLDLKVDLDAKNTNGDTALHLAIKNDHDDIALVLIKHGASVTTTNKSGKNALKLAMENDVPESLKLISAIMGMQSGAPDLAGYRTLIEQGDYNRLNNVLQRFPEIATEYLAINPFGITLTIKDEFKALKTAEVLQANQVNINGPGSIATPPLIQATLTKRKNFIQFFLSNDANPHVYDQDGKSALIHAVEMNNREFVQLLRIYSAADSYTATIDGKKYSFNACKVAKAVAKKLTTSEELKTNEKIRSILDCGLLGWFF